MKLKANKISLVISFIFSLGLFFLLSSLTAAPTYALSCSSSYGCTPTPQSRCAALGGRLIAPSQRIHINGSILRFTNGSTNCYKPTVAGCNIVWGGTSTKAGCKCADVYGTNLGLVNVKSYCGSGLYCKKSMQSGSNYIGTCVR